MSQLHRRTGPPRGVRGRVLELLAAFYFAHDDVLTILFLRLVLLVCFFVFSLLSVLAVRSLVALPTDPRPWATHDSGYHGSRITTPSRCKAQLCVQRAHRTRFFSLRRSLHTSTGGRGCLHHRPHEALLITPCRDFAFRYTVLHGDGPNLSHFISHGKSEI